MSDTPTTIKSTNFSIKSVLTTASITLNVLWIALYVAVSMKDAYSEGDGVPMSSVLHAGNAHRRLLNVDEIFTVFRDYPARIALEDSYRKLLENREEEANEEERSNSIEPSSGRSERGAFQLPLEYVPNMGKPITSNGHCLGNNYRENSWYYSSCHVNLLCYDMANQDWVIMDNPTETAILRAILDEDASESIFTRDMYTSAADLDVDWSSGVINPQWAGPDWVRLKRKFRRVAPQGYYSLPDNVVMVPFHSMAGFNPGHLIWDDFMALWLLLDVFDLWKKDKHMLYMRESFEPGKGIWATCDNNEMLHGQCRKSMPKFFPMMGSHTLLFDKPTKETVFETEEFVAESQLVCAKQGVVGLGTLSDHGMKEHGWKISDYEWNHNVGRGAQLWRFRNFMMENIFGREGSKSLRRRREKPILIFSERSSRRAFDMSPYIEFVKEKFAGEVEVRRVIFSGLSMEEQASMVAEASMMFSVAGGGTFSGMFLPRGASLVVWYQSDIPDGGQIVGDVNSLPRVSARLDFDVWNNAGYIRTHWLPTIKDGFRPLETPPGPILEALIRHELDILAKQGY